MTTSNKTKAKVFEFFNEEIIEGRGDLMLPGSDVLSGCIKRYLDGGENKMHCHPDEDHTFYILQGAADFRIDSDDNIVHAGKFEAVYLPAGTMYWFHSSGGEKLIMLRVGTEQASDRIIDDQLVKSNKGSAPRAKVKELPF